MRTVHVQIVNESRTVSRARDVERAARALQKQVSRDFAPVWGVGADLEVVPRDRIHPDAWLMAILDEDSSSSDDGWHELTPWGLPLAKVMARQSIADAGEWTSTASHELLEMLVDPGMNRVVTVDYGGHARLYAFEVCDPVQGDAYRYRIGGVHLSDFVYPEWFEGFPHARGTRFDHVGACSKPFQLVSGGYSMVTHGDADRGWKSLAWRKGSGFLQRGSRRKRRSTPRSEWRRSRRV